MPTIIEQLDRVTAWMNEHPAEVCSITGLDIRPYGCSITLEVPSMKRVLAGESVERSFYGGYVHFRLVKDGIEFRACEKDACPEPDTVTL